MDQLLTVDEVSRVLRVPPKTLYSWRHRRLGPPAVRIGKFLRYDERELAKWLQAQRDPQPVS